MQNYKIDKSIFSFHGSFVLQVKPAVFGTAFGHEPGFKAKNLIKY